MNRRNSKAFTKLELELLYTDQYFAVNEDLTDTLIMVKTHAGDYMIIEVYPTVPQDGTWVAIIGTTNASYIFQAY